jgi:hypothetical protein
MLLTRSPFIAVDQKRTGGQTTQTDSRSQHTRAGRRGSHRKVRLTAHRARNGPPNLRSPDKPPYRSADRKHRPGPTTSEPQFHAPKSRSRSPCPRCTRSAFGPLLGHGWKDRAIGSDDESPAIAGPRGSAPDRIRTCDLRFRRASPDQRVLALHSQNTQVLKHRGAVSGEVRRSVPDPPNSPSNDAVVRSDSDANAIRDASGCVESESEASSATGATARR